MFLDTQQGHGYAAAVMSGRGRFGRGLWLMVALILLGLVTHHCVLPSPAEAGPSHHHGESESGHGVPALHAVPCDVVVAKAPSPAPSPGFSSVGLDSSATLRRQPDFQPRVSPAGSRVHRPLYVLHAALLI